MNVGRRWTNPASTLIGGGTAFGLGFASGANAPVGAGAAALAFLSIGLPWTVLFGLLAWTAMASRARFVVAGGNVQLAHLILVPFAIRAYVLSRKEDTPDWSWVEWVLVGFIALQFLTSVRHAVDKKQSIFAAGLLALGAVAYITTRMSVNTRRRLIFAARAVLISALLGAMFGIVCEVLYHTTSSTFGISAQPGAHGAPHGLSFEYDIFGSMVGSATVAFFVLMRERNPLFSYRFSMFGFWTCLVATGMALTRAAWIGTAIAMLCVVVVRRRAPRPGLRMWQIAAVSFAVAIGVITVGILANADSAFFTAKNPFAKKGGQLLDFSGGTGAARLSEWTIALEQVRHSLLFGLGTNSYGQRNPGTISAGTVKPAYIGSLYVRVLYDSGILGVLLYGLFLCGVLWPKRLYQNGAGELTAVARAFLFGYVTLGIAYASTDATLMIWPWLFLGVLAAATRLAAKEDRAIRLARRQARRELVPVSV